MRGSPSCPSSTICQRHPVGNPMSTTLNSMIEHLSRNAKEQTSDHVLHDQHGRLIRVVGANANNAQCLQARRTKKQPFPADSRWACLGSNQGPPACEAGALPLSYTPRTA